jgi:hypothetical protein
MHQMAQVRDGGFDCVYQTDFVARDTLGYVTDCDWPIVFSPRHNHHGHVERVQGTVITRRHVEPSERKARDWARDNVGADVPWEMTRQDRIDGKYQTAGSIRA